MARISEQLGVDKSQPTTQQTYWVSPNPQGKYHIFPAFADLNSFKYSKDIE